MRCSRAPRTFRLRGVAPLLACAFTLAGAGTARASDLHLIQIGGGSGTVPPPNILFLFDSSGSMNNLICEELDGARRCRYDSNMARRSAPNNASVCKNTALENLTGPDVTSDGVGDPYRGLYDDDGVTYRNSPYPPFDERKSGPNDDYYPPWTIHHHSTLHTAFDLEVTGSGTTDRARIDDAITRICQSLTTDCQRRSRCIYSLRTQGYFWEPSSSCASGDPLGMCTCVTPQPRKLGASCNRNRDCDSDICKDGRCSTCADNNQCSGSNKCVRTDCQYNYCKNETCSAPSSTDCSDSSWSGNAYPYLLGDFFNFYPPKGVALIKAFVDTISNMSGDARIGISDFDDTNGRVQYEIKPPCSQASGNDCFDGDPDTQCFNPSDANLLNYLYNSLEFDDSTPLAIKLDNAGRYFTTTTGQNVPICDYGAAACGTANNFVVMVSDGMPSSDATRASHCPFVNGKVTNFRDGYYKDQSPDAFVDDVARALTQIDLRSDIDGSQTLYTYTVSYGITEANDPTRCVGLLDDVATAGNGRCLPATSVKELRDALTEIVSEIIHRALGFAAPSVATTRQTGTAALSNATFRPSTDFALWEGHVYGFELCDEAQSRKRPPECTCVVNSEDEVCVRDANGNAVSYDDEGYLVSKPYWDAALCLAGDAAGTLAAVPQDQGNLDVSSCYRAADERVIKTAVVDVAAPTTTLTSADQIDFTAANVSAGSRLLNALAAADVTAGQKLVNFFRGFDAYDIDADGSTTEDRNLNTIQSGGQVLPGWWKLGDIFHSIPPVPKVLGRPTGEDIGGWASTKSHQEFAKDWSARDQVLLVGANDGMLHAFLTGVWSSTLDRYVEDSADAPELGKEMWAFVSPEMLPELKNLCDPTGTGCGIANHRFMVDGSVMARSIWTGLPTDDKDSTANKSKWRTIAVYGHRDGGRTYVALDVTDPSTPTFLWQFPQPGTVEATQMGMSWLDVFPAPASIGPLRWDHDNDPDTTYVDRWVVLLSGGYDQLDLKGRALFILDAYTGALLWKAEHTSSGVTAAMDYSFPATPVFYGADDGGRLPYIGGIVAADHGGQLWHIPTPPQGLTSGRFTFTPELVFRTLESPIPPNTDAVLTASEYQRRPFFFAPTLSTKRGKIWVIIGTGDRDWLIPFTSMNSTIRDYVCNDRQRLYSFQLEACSSGGSPRPCTEADLHELDIDAGAWADDTTRGWFYELPAGEKIATPFNIAGGYAAYAVYAPTSICGGNVDLCTADNKGEGKNYLLHYITGKPLDLNGDEDLTLEDAWYSVGSGVPTAPIFSTAVSAAGVSATLIGGASSRGSGASGGGIVAQQIDLGGGANTVEIMRFVVPRELHDALH